MLAKTDLILGLAEVSSGRLVGFSRILTDGIYRGVIYDVVIAEDQRGQSLGKTLLDAVLSYPPVQVIEDLALFCTPEMMPFYKKWALSIASAKFISWA
ncbi:MAG: GNAT family N-acetyltransferase [Cyanobacteria bacterium J06635_15]